MYIFCLLHAFGSSLPLLWPFPVVTKVDMEGSEFDLLHSILPKRRLADHEDPSDAHGDEDRTSLLLPFQIAFELHYRSDEGDPQPRGMGDLVLLWDRLFEAGYRVVSREDKASCEFCAVYTVVRARC